MDNPFLTIDQRLEAIEKSLGLILASQTAGLTSMSGIPSTDDQRFSMPQLSEYLGVDKTTVHRYKSNGVLPFYKAGRTLFFKKSEVDAAMSSIQPRNKKGGPKQ